VKIVSSAAASGRQDDPCLIHLLGDRTAGHRGRDDRVFGRFDGAPLVSCRPPSTVAPLRAVTLDESLCSTASFCTPPRSGSLLLVPLGRPGVGAFGANRAGRHPRQSRLLPSVDYFERWVSPCSALSTPSSRAPCPSTSTLSATRRGRVRGPFMECDARAVVGEARARGADRAVAGDPTRRAASAVAHA